LRAGILGKGIFLKAQKIVVLLLVMFGTLSCSLDTRPLATPTAVDEVGTVVAATMQAYTASPAGTQVNGTTISFENVSFVIPEGLASGANPASVPAIGEGGGAPWETAPAHVKIGLISYQLQGKFHEAAMYIYPADEYGQANPKAAEQIDRIQKILAGATMLNETLPRIPWFNAEQLIAAHIQMIRFQNGRGVRALTEYAQYFAPINNNELFYHFEGLTEDNNYYIVAVLPVTAPILPENEKPDAAVPEGGVPIPTDIGVNNNYYISVTEKLNSLAPDEYSPSLNTLDALIQSILVTTP
jgi:hypothetical protein